MKKHIPNFITCLNLFSGCVGIALFTQGEFRYMCWMIFLAAFFDFLDGMAARLLHVSSEIGKQLDSLADAVSFGVLPGLIMYGLIKITCRIYTIDGTMLAQALPLLGFLITIFSALRLAKFNIDTRQTSIFIGLPTPANSIFFAGLGLIIFNNSHNLTNHLLNIYLLLALIFLSCFMLVANIPLIALKFKNLSWNNNQYRYILILIAVLSVAFLQIAALPLIILAYILISIIENKFSHNEIQS